MAAILILLLSLLFYTFIKNKPDPKSFFIKKNSTTTMNFISSLLKAASSIGSGGGGGEKKEFYDFIIFWVVIVTKNSSDTPLMWIGALNQWTPIPQSLTNFLYNLQSPSPSITTSSSNSIDADDGCKETALAIEEKMAGNYEEAAMHYLAASYNTSEPPVLQSLHNAITCFKVSTTTNKEPSAQYEEAVERAVTLLLSQSKQSKAADYLLELLSKYSDPSKKLQSIERVISILDDDCDRSDRSTTPTSTSSKISTNPNSYKLNKLKRETFPDLLVSTGKYERASLLYETAYKSQLQDSIGRGLACKTWLKMMFCKIRIDSVSDVSGGGGFDNDHLYCCDNDNLYMCTNNNNNNNNSNNTIIKRSREWKFINSFLKNNNQEAKRHFEFLKDDRLPREIRDWFCKRLEEMALKDDHHHGDGDAIIVL